MELFKPGSVWLRADFHLHTRADKEAFKNWDEQRSFKKTFIDKLAHENIRVGVISNHNKFAPDEFKALAGEARKQEIFLLPGVELSVGEGNGIHTLVIFEPEQWISQHEDFINRFLDEAYPHLSRQDRENRNARTQWNLIQTLEKLQEHKQHHRDSFAIMAHVDQDNGFCHELNAGRQQELIGYPLFKEFVLGFQKCATRQHIENLKKWLAPHIPAFVEGSDNKDLDSVGKTRVQDGQPQKSFLKDGDFNFYAVKYALMDPHRHVVAPEAPKPQNALIESLSLQTTEEAPLSGQTLYFNASMNNLIGIRGSGKSTILELVRYALNIKFDPLAKDTDYKQRLVEHALRSGGKVILALRDKHGACYRIERVLGERPAIYRDDTRLPQFSVDETLMNVLYFGQKDLSEVGSLGFSQSLMEKFFGAQVGPIREAIDGKRKQVLQTLDRLEELKADAERKKELLEEKAAVNERLRIFKEKKVDEKLNRQVQYNKDRLQISQMIETAQGLQEELNRIVENSLDVFNDYSGYETPENKTLFAKVRQTWQNILDKLHQVKSIADSLQPDLEAMRGCLSEMNGQIDRLQDEFAEIKRTINLPEINPDDFIKFSKRLDMITAKLAEIEKIETKYRELRQALENYLRDLNGLWHEEYQTLQKSVDRLNAKGLSITVELQYKGAKKNFHDYVGSLIKGSGVTARNLESVISSYNDCIEIYRDINATDSKLQEILADAQLQKFKEAFQANLRDLLTYQVPNLYILKYNGKNIAEHSLGQRASALVVFLLARRENDLIIIDQPEDDIDNQSIYQDVIRELSQLKEQTQFVFATHNPNIPVLGECEQVFCCRYEEGKINLQAGSIDRPDIQEAIIEIMEGGREAFEQRTRKYSEWKH
jgi:predicted ATPase/archaellum component FlaC